MFSSSTILCAVIAVVTAESDFCLRRTYTRPSVIPKVCHSHQERIGLFCYDKCPDGYERVGCDCHSICPSGLKDEGLTCRCATYGRGVGYPWKFGDGMNDKKQWERCLHDHPEGCEKHLLIVYPKCNRGYKSIGCCICRPEKCDCDALGLNHGTDLSCFKKIIIGEPRIGICSHDQEFDAGLCYPKCKSENDHGVGYLCWGGPPRDWVECGMAAARNPSLCEKTLFGRFFSVCQLVMNTITWFPTSDVDLLKAPADPDKLAKLKQAYDSLKDNEEFQQAVAHYHDANESKKGFVSINGTMQATTNEELVLAAALVAALCEPDDIKGEHPECDKM